MRSPRRVCSSGSSQTAHSLPTKVRSRLERVLSTELAMTLLSRAPILRELLLTADLIELADELERGTSEACERPGQRGLSVWLFNPPQKPETRLSRGSRTLVQQRRQLLEWSGARLRRRRPRFARARRVGAEEAQVSQVGSDVETGLRLIHRGCRVWISVIGVPAASAKH